MDGINPHDFLRNSEDVPPEAQRHEGAVVGVQGVSGHQASLLRRPAGLRIIPGIRSAGDQMGVIVTSRDSWGLIVIQSDDMKLVGIHWDK